MDPDVQVAKDNFDNVQAENEDRAEEAKRALEEARDASNAENDRAVEDAG